MPRNGVQACGLRSRASWAILWVPCRAWSIPADGTHFDRLFHPVWHFGNSDTPDPDCNRRAWVAEGRRELRTPRFHVRVCRSSARSSSLPRWQRHKARLSGIRNSSAWCSKAASCPGLCQPLCYRRTTPSDCDRTEVATQHWSWWYGEHRNPTQPNYRAGEAD